MIPKYLPCTAPWPSQGSRFRCNTSRKIVALRIGTGAAVLVFAWCDYNWLREQWKHYIKEVPEIMLRAMEILRRRVEWILTIDLLVSNRSVEKSKALRVRPTQPDAPSITGRSHFWSPGGTACWWPLFGHYLAEPLVTRSATLTFVAQPSRATSTVWS